MALYRLPKVQWGDQLDWETIWGGSTTTTSSSKDIWLEIGCGNGENLLALAQKHYPFINFVGADVHNPGIGNLCQRMQQSIQKNEYWKEYVLFTAERSNYKSAAVIEAAEEATAGPPAGASTISAPENSLPATIKDDNTEENHKSTAHNMSSSLDPSSCPIYSNLRFYGGDGVKLLPFIPSNSIAAILVTFPDPFPKNSQAEFRVLQKHTLLEIHRLLRVLGDNSNNDNNNDPHATPPEIPTRHNRGRLFLATDHEGHWEWCRTTIDRVNAEHKAKLAAAVTTTTTTGGDENTTSASDLFQEIEAPDRREWLPVISKYEQKGWDEGRRTYLSCWEVIK